MMVCFAEESIQRDLVRATACMPNASLNEMKCFVTADKTRDKPCNVVQTFSWSVTFPGVVSFLFFKAVTIEQLTAAILTSTALDSILLSYFTLKIPQQLSLIKMWSLLQIAADFSGVFAPDDI